MLNGSPEVRSEDVRAEVNTRVDEWLREADLKSFSSTKDALKAFAESLAFDTSEQA